MGKVMVVDDAAAVLKVIVRQFVRDGEELAGVAAAPAWSLEGAMSNAVPSFLAGLRSFGSL
jgi:hypothetical protein